MTALNCNICNTNLSGSVYRTVCSHIFCETCCFRHFSEHCEVLLQISPFLHLSIFGFSVHTTALRDSDFEEMTLGVDIQPIRDSLYQHILNGSKWSDILDRFLKTSDSLSDVLAFLFSQLHFENSQKGQVLSETASIMEKLKQENAKLNMHLKTSTSQLELRLREVDQRMRMKEREFGELQSAYKEKMKKCQAWEGAYNQLRASSSSSSFKSQFSSSSPPMRTPIRSNSLPSCLHLIILVVFYMCCVCVLDAPSPPHPPPLLQHPSHSTSSPSTCIIIIIKP